MNNRFEEFFRNHRNEFDDEEPRTQLWDKVRRELELNQQGEGPAKVILMRRFRWVAAAAAVLTIGLGSYYFLSRPTEPALVQKPEKTITPATGNDIISDINPTLAKEVYHFTQLIELKQEELKVIEKEHPNLYREFMTDIDKLDSSYNALKHELPSNPNREQLLEAMIQNLQLQTELLNRQLQIIQQIKQSKSKSNESNSKIG